MSEVVIKKLTTISELEEMQVLEREVWNMSPIPIHQTLTAAKNGGIVLGAYENDQMVGFLYSFAGFNDKKIYLCSHMLGIKPEFQKRKIGKRLKMKQAELALTAGYSSIIWTYDPLLSLNANLNLHKLGAVVSHYIENNYGEMNDTQNAGLPSDRFLVTWSLEPTNSAGVGRCDVDTDLCLMEVGDDGGLLKVISVIEHQLSLKNRWLVPIPHDFHMIRKANQELALDWRMKTRKIFKKLFAEGFVGVDLIKSNNGVSYYLFVREDLGDQK